MTSYTIEINDQKHTIESGESSCPNCGHMKGVIFDILEPLRDQDPTVIFLRFKCDFYKTDANMILCPYLIQKS